MVSHGAMVTMECRVEASNLWHLWTPSEKCTDGSKVVRLMERRQRDIAFKVRHNLCVNQHGTVVLWASMHDAMPDRF
jgi:hypothetical protein